MLPVLFPLPPKFRLYEPSFDLFEPGKDARGQGQKHFFDGATDYYGQLVRILWNAS